MEFKCYDNPVSRIWNAISMKCQPDVNMSLAHGFQIVYNKMLSLKSDVASKQDVLISGTNIKTINDESLLGSGNIAITAGAVDSVNGKTGAVVLNDEDIKTSFSWADTVSDALDDLNRTKADIVSPTFTGTPKAPTASSTTSNTQIATTAFVKSVTNDKQDKLVSGTNIKTVNGNSLLGSGNITISGGSTPDFQILEFEVPINVALTSQEATIETLENITEDGYLELGIVGTSFTSDGSGTTPEEYMNVNSVYFKKVGPNTYNSLIVNVQNLSNDGTFFSGTVYVQILYVGV